MKWITQLRMRGLPKPEYFMMQSLVKEFQLDDPSELFASLIRLAVEVRQFEGIDGEAWFKRIITETVTSIRG
jgi:hypothetical protein